MWFIILMPHIMHRRLEDIFIQDYNLLLDNSSNSNEPLWICLRADYYYYFTPVSWEKKKKKK